MPLDQKNYSISVDRTAAKVGRLLRKNPLDLSAAMALRLELEPRIVISDKFGGRILGDDNIFVFPRYKRWTILIHPRSGGWTSTNLWYGMVVLHLLFNCNYRPNQYMRKVQEVIYTEACRLADACHINQVLYDSAQPL